MSTYERDRLNVNGDTVNLRDAGSVRFDRAQSLTAAQQAQARDNIGAGTGTGGVTGVKGSAENDYRTGQVNLTPANIGLGNVDNTSDADKPVSTAQQAALSGKVDKVTGKGLSTNDYTDADKAALAGKLDASQKGVAGGVAELDSGGKVPSAQLPSYVDDVVEYASASAFPATGETGKIYVDTTTNKTYRWSGSGYVEISPSLALGETSSTAYRGDRGKAAYDHAAAKGSAFASGLYKIATNAEGHVTAATAAEKTDITALGIPGQDTTYQNATQSASGLMSAADKAKLDTNVMTKQIYTDVICNNTSRTSTGDVLSYFENIPTTANWIIMLYRKNYAWQDSFSMYFLLRFNGAYSAKSIIKEGSYSKCPKLDENYHVILPADGSPEASVTIEIMQL